MADHDNDLVAMLYEIGGRRDTNSSRLVRRSDLDQPEAIGEPVPYEVARSAYRTRVAARSRRGGAGR